MVYNLDAIKQYLNTKEFTRFNPPTPTPVQAPEPVQMPTQSYSPSPAPVESPSVPYQQFDPDRIVQFLQQKRQGIQTQQNETGTSGVPLTPERELQEVDTERLQTTLTGQRNEIEGLHGEEAPQKDENPGFLSRTFDVLSRPNYAIANAVKSAIDEDKEGNTAADLWHGLSGQKKTVFSDVLDEAGVENGIAKGVGGFVLDVALDPTTYIGVGVVKAAGKGAIKAAGLQAAKEVMSSPAAQKAARDAAENTIQRQLLEKLGPKGPKMADGPTLKTVDDQEKAVTKLSEKLLKDQAKEKMHLAEKAVDTAGKVNFKFAGKTLGGSTKAYTGISRAFKPIRELEPVQQAATLFRPKSELGEMWDITRLHEGVSIGQFEDHLKFFKDNAVKFNKAQRKEITHAIEQGRKLDDPEMQDFADLTKRLFRQFYEDEAAVGLHKEGGSFIEDYVYHMYKVDPDKATSYKTSTGRKGAPGFSKERSLPTLEEAKKAGMKPEEDVLAIMQERAAKHYREMTHLSIMEDAVKNFGVRGGSKEADKVNKALKDMGTELQEFSFSKPNGEVFKALFPKEVVGTLNLMRTIHGENKAARQLVRHLDKSQRHMKYWMTVANPGHHVRNFVGNAYMAYQDGVRNPARYMQALRGVRANAGKIGDDTWEKAAQTKVKIGDGYSDANELMKLYKMTGTKSGFFDVEVSRGVSGKASEFVRSVSNQREDTARLGHFIDALAKSKPKNWSKMSLNQKAHAAMDASKRVRKWQLDYGDLTDFEKSTARRIMMFYTFMRKNTPLQVEMLMTRPGKVLNVKKANTAIQQILGIEEPALEDEDFWERVPEWIQVMNAPQIGGDGNFVQKILNTEDPVYGNMLLPTSDLNRIKGPKGIARDLLSEIRPELKIPIETSTDTQIFSGAPVPGGGQYISQQLPVTNLARKFLDREHDVPMGQELFNYLTGLSTQTVTPQRQQGELRRQQTNVQEVLRALREKELDKFLEETQTNRR